ncbi:hypothetical protein BMS3Abin04_01508 [bacterium BMS3Abin04]|nr:hypothetical protein BMS3Abin04_01508 [bacterium BMS3Abin04]
MKAETIKYILDTNVFIEAFRRYYSFDIAPSFWEFLINTAKTKKIISIDRVYSELTNGNDVLAEWIEKKFRFAFIDTKNNSEILNKYAELMNWAVNQTQYSQNAIDEFARVENADPWLIAIAIVNNFTIVTHEVFDTQIKKKIPIPNVCKEFNVDYINTFEMLRKLNFKFN